MDRARRTTVLTSAGRRKTQAASTSPQSTPESSGDQQPPASPVLANDSDSPQSAPSGRRSSKTLQHALSFSTPGSSRIVKLRTRPKAMDDYNIDYGEEEKDSPRKGGHTLRRRARVDYTSEHIDDQPVVPSSTSSTRSKKRRSDMSNESEDVSGHQEDAQRDASAEGDTASSRRRNPMRKTSEVKSYTEDAEDDDNDVQDTIEVGISFSDDENSSLAHTSTTNAALREGSAESPLAAKTAAASEEAEEPSADANPSLLTDSPDAIGDPEEQLQGEARGAERQSHDVDAVVDKPKEEAQAAESDLANNSLTVSTDTVSRSAAEEVKDEQFDSESMVDPALYGDVEAQAGTAADAETKTVAQASDEPDAKAPGPTDESIDPDVSMANVDDADGADEADERKEKSTSVRDNDGEDENAQSPSQQLTEQQPEHTPEDTEVPKEELAAAGDGEDAQGTPAAEVAESSQQSQTVMPDNTATEASMTETQEDGAGQESSKVDADAPAGPTPMEGVIATKTEPKPPASQQAPSSSVAHRPQPTPTGRWANLTPYVDGELVTYPEKKEATPEDDTPAEDATPDDKEADKDSNDMEPMVEDNDDTPDALVPEAPTPALNTPTRGSPVPESMEPTASNSPAPPADDGDEGEASGSEDDLETRRYFRYRKLRDPEDYISAIENYEDMTTAELYELLEAVNVSLVQWQTEWTGLGKIVDDYENSLRRRLADSKYESRTRNLHQHGINYEEPEFVVKGYRAKERETLTETRYLQGQDRIMAAAYGFEYDPHPSKIGRQNPETQQVGIMTRGRSLRNQPRQTAKATEADEVTGKRSRKPVQLFDPAAQDVSRSSTPAPARTRRRRNGDDDGAGSVNGDGNSDADEPPSRTRRRRGQRPKTSAPNSFNEDYGTPQDMGQEDVTRSARRGRVRPASRYDEALAYQSMDDDSQRDSKPPKRHLLTLKIPRGKNFSEPSSAITDNGDSRPSTASSESSSHTAESSYSFRPKRQKRFRDEQDEVESTGQGPPKKRGKRSAEEALGSGSTYPSIESSQGATRKAPKIKVVRAVQPSRNGTPTSSVGAGEGDEPRKDYKLMTKSEKMSASMKSRWANGNMAGAVEKRKATLAAKKAAQAAGDPKGGGVSTPKNKVKPKKEGSSLKQEAQPMPQGTPGMNYQYGDP